MVTPLDSKGVLRQRVSDAAQDVQRLEREFEAAAGERHHATSDAARHEATRRAAKISGEMTAARERLSEAKRSLAEAQGDANHSDEATPPI